MKTIPATTTIGVSLILMLILFIVPALGAATTSVQIIKYADDGTTILNQTAVDFQWMESHLPVYGDGVTHYYHQGPVFNDSIPDKWNPEENDPAILTKDYGAVKGTDLKDLCDLVGGMEPGDDNVTLKASDGFSKAFAYSSVYNPPARAGPIVLTWYRADQGYVNGSYSTGIRNVMFADTSTNPWGDHVFGLWDMHESYPEAFWYYYQPGLPSTTGLSVQNIAYVIIYSSIPPPEIPSANFSANPLSGTVPLTVQFTDSSENDPTSWAWDFDGDGDVDSTAQSPAFTYAVPGSYSVNLTVTNAAGSDSEVKTGYINAFEDTNTTPVISFVPASASVLPGGSGEYQIVVDSLPKGLAGYDLVCTISNTSVAGMLSVSYPSWARLQNTTNYSAWSVRLSGVDTDRQIQPGAADVILANVTLRGDMAGVTPIVIRNVHMDADGGDATNSSTNNGQLIVQSQIPASPVANFTGTPRSGNAPLSVQFTDTSAGSPTSWAWDFNNDGVIDNTSRNPSYIYNSPGTYSVNLTVTNAGGNDSELKINYITVQTRAPPVANFTATPRSGNAPLSVQFTDTSTGSPTSWAWDFNNDGVIDNTTRNPVYTYPSPGTYSVNLTVTNAGGSDSELKINYISVQSPPPAPPVANFTGTPRTGTAPLSVQFTDTSNGYPTSWAWDFNNDGVIDNTTRNPVYTYPSPGTYSVNLTVTNAGGSDSELKTNYISVLTPPPAPPVANFTGTPRSGHAPLSVQFTDTSTGSPTSWAWDFNNDGVIDNTSRNPSYIYNSPGTYSVNLTVTNAGGNDSELKTNYITALTPPPAPPVANFTGTPRSGNAPLSVQFTDTSTGSPTSWAWDFNNDGVIDNTSRNPSYTYLSPGIYLVNLTVTNAGGSDSERKTNYITVQAPPSGTASVSGWVATGSDIGSVNVPGIRVRFASSVPDLSNSAHCWEATTNQQGTYSIAGLPSGVTLYAKALSPVARPNAYLERPIQYQVNSGRLVTCPNTSSTPQVPPIAPDGKMQVNWVLTQNPNAVGLFLL
jgi:PKD repeat protein